MRVLKEVIGDVLTTYQRVTSPDAIVLWKSVYVYYITMDSG